jgi:hypothetical protein
MGHLDPMQASTRAIGWRSFLERWARSSTPPAGHEEVFQVLGQELRPSGQVTGNQLPGSNTILDCSDGDIEDSGKVPVCVSRLERKPLDCEDFLQKPILGRL